MTQSISRRAVLLGSLALAFGTQAAAAQTTLYGDMPASDPGWIDPALLPPPESPVDFPIAPVDLRKIPEEFRRQPVAYNGSEPANSIVIDPGQRFLYFVLEGGTALRFGVGVGRAGFSWSGQAEVRMKRRWPRWVPPPEMVKRDKNAQKWANGMPGGPENPLGARALYLFSQTLYDGFFDSGYRIHGTNDPSSIGKAMSSGCVRMLNQDVAEVFERAPIGTRVVVRGAVPPGESSGLMTQGLKRRTLA